MIIIANITIQFLLIFCKYFLFGVFRSDIWPLRETPEITISLETEFTIRKFSTTPIITSKSTLENLSNHNKHKPTFTNTFVFKTKYELKCQNELFF